MPESNGNFISKITSKLKSDNDMYLKTKLEISKAFFIFTASIYFFAYLCTIASFQKEIMGIVMSGVFPLFIFGVCVLVYDVTIYSLELKSDKGGMIKLPLILILGLVFAGVIALNFGLKF